MPLPASLSIVGSVDTTGVAPGPLGDVKGTTIIFDLDDEANGYVEERDISNADRFAEKAAAASAPAYQEEADSWVADGNQTPPMTKGAPQVESPDTTDTATGGDVPVAHVEPEKPVTTVTQVEETTATTETAATGETGVVDTTETGSAPVGEQVAEKVAAVEASVGEATGEERTEVEGNTLTEDGDSLAKVEADLDEQLTLPKLAKLAKAKEVEVEGTHKADFVKAIAAAGFTADDYVEDED